MVYYGVFLSAPTIGGNMYLNFFLASIIELPAIPGGVWIYNRLDLIQGDVPVITLFLFSIEEIENTIESLRKFEGYTCSCTSLVARVYILSTFITDLDERKA